MADLGQSAIALMQTARTLSESVGNDNSNFANTDFENTVLENECPAAPFCNRKARYRTIDGSCNNLQNPLFGKSLTPLQRILDNDYADGLMLPRVDARGQELPSARFVSTTTRFNQVNEDPNFTALLMAFGQFLDHDLDHVPIRGKMHGNDIIGGQH